MKIDSLYFEDDAKQFILFCEEKLDITGIIFIPVNFSRCVTLDFPGTRKDWNAAELLYEEYLNNN